MIVLNPPAAAFSPLDLAPDALWDPSDTATITVVTGCSVITDKSGHGSSLSQGTGANQPASGTRTINSLNCLDFDGADDYLTGGDILDLGTNGLTISAIVAHDASDTTGAIACKSLAGASTPRYSFLRESGALLAHVHSVADGSKAMSVSDSSTAARHVMYVLTRGGNLELFINNVSQGTTTITDVSSWDSPWSFLVGALNNSTDGLTPIAGYYLDGRLGELFVKLAPLDSTQRGNLHTYYQGKWAV